MEFKAYLIKYTDSPKIQIALLGVFLFLVSIIFWIVPKLNSYAIYITLLGFALVLFGAISASKRSLLEVNKSLLIISENGITIGDSFFAFNQIEDLNIFFHSFYSQSSFGYYTENSGMIEHGISNRISFIHLNSKMSEMFYLQNQGHANSLLHVINELKKRGISISLSFRNYYR